MKVSAKAVSLLVNSLKALDIKKAQWDTTEVSVVLDGANLLAQCTNEVRAVVSVKAETSIAKRFAFTVNYAQLMRITSFVGPVEFIPDGESVKLVCGPVQHVWHVGPGGPLQGGRSSECAGLFVAPVDRVNTWLLHAAKEYSRYAINGVNVVCSGKRTEVAVTDGRRLLLHKARTMVSGHADWNGIVNGSTLRAAVKLAKVFRTDELSLWADPVEKQTDGTPYAAVWSQFRNDVGTVEVRGGIHGGAFPPYNDVIPADDRAADTVAVFDCEAMRAAMREAVKFTDDDSRGVRFTFHADRIDIRAGCADKGSVVLSVPADVTFPDGGKSWDIGFNPTFIDDACKAMAGLTATARFVRSNKPGKFVGDGVTVVVMPVNLSTESNGPKDKPKGKDKPAPKVDAPKVEPTPAPVATKAPATIADKVTVVHVTGAPTPAPKPTTPATVVEVKQPAPTLSEAAAAIVAALKRLGKPANKPAILAESGIPRAAWSDALSEVYRARLVKRAKDTADVLHTLAA